MIFQEKKANFAREKMQNAKFMKICKIISEKMPIFSGGGYRGAKIISEKMRIFGGGGVPGSYQECQGSSDNGPLQA